MSQRIPATELAPDFRGRAEAALADGQLRNNFRVAMDSLMTKRANAFPDADECEGLRELGNRVKAGALSGLPDLLEQLEQKLALNAWSQKFMEADVGVSGVNFALAETGTLLLVENEGNGRMSTTVPPVHIALLNASEIHDHLYDMMVAQEWAAGLPTNVLLVSGPSKTADIEQVLAYGAHGPRELIVLVLEDA